MENGWNDDLFPVDETVKYYNKVRAAYPNQAMQLFYLDLGHNPRSASTPSTSDVGKLTAAQNTWFGYYLKGEGSEPAEAKGGVRTITSFCPQSAGGSGVEHAAANWASLTPGEVRFTSAAEQTIRLPARRRPRRSRPGRSARRRPPATTHRQRPTSSREAPASGFTIDGASTVIAEFSTLGANDQVIARLYDENAPAGTQQLIGRQTYRPLNVGEGFTKQTFQLHPNAWNVAAGHVVKLELLTKDSTYALNNTSPNSVQVKNLELRLPTTDAPGSAEGLVQAPLPHYLPPGYTLAQKRDPGRTGRSDALERLDTERRRRVHALLGTHPGGDGTHLHPAAQERQRRMGECGNGPHRAANTPSRAGSPESEGTWTYRVTESNESEASEPSAASAAIKVDQSAPNAPSVESRPCAGLCGWRWLVQGHGDAVLHRQRRSAVERWERGFGR